LRDIGIVGDKKENVTDEIKELEEATVPMPVEAKHASGHSLSE
jgi:hypothetical protein